MWESQERTTELVEGARNVDQEAEDQEAREGLEGNQRWQ